MKKNKNLLDGMRELDRTMPTAAERTADEYLCADGVAQIDICLCGGAALFNPLSYGKQRDLSRDIYELIDEKLYTIPLRYPVRLCFHGPLPDEQVQQEVREVIREHYMYVVRDKQEDLRINMVKTVGLSVLGAVLLAAYFTLSLTVTNPVFMELLSIAGWVAAWEALDSWMFERRDIRMEYLTAGQSALCEVAFAPED